MALKQELQELARANGMKYCGIASVDRFANLPAGHRPNDLLPGAKSVLVTGMVIPDGAIEGIGGPMANGDMPFSPTWSTAGRLQERIPEGTVNKVGDWLAIAVKDDQWNRMERAASMCGRCLTTCPAGLAHP